MEWNTERILAVLLISPMNVDLLYWRIFWWVAVCFFAGRSAGKIIDIQYCEQEGKPSYVAIPDRWKNCFAFAICGEIR